MTSPRPVTVVGLGAMGRALAHSFLAAGHPTTVWNRTPDRAAALTAAGAVEVPDLADAVRPGQLTVVCLLDPAAVDGVITHVGANGWRNVPVVNLTSSTPHDARALSARFTNLGAHYLDGKIMVTTDLIGTSAAHVLYSGEERCFRDQRAALDALGGTAEYLGADPGRAAAHDLAMLDMFFTAMASFLHAAALARADDVDASSFVPYGRRMLQLLDHSLEGLAANVDTGHHDGTEDNLTMELAALDHIVTTSRRHGLDASLPAAVQALAAGAIDRGYGADSFSRVVDEIRLARQTAPALAQR